MPEVLQRQNLCQAILPYIKEIHKRLGTPSPYRIVCHLYYILK